MPEFTLEGLGFVEIALMGYLLGSIPFGIVWARVFGLGDLRKIGSGNIGATNVLRTGSKVAAALTLVCDALKGGAAVALGRALVGEDAGQLAGLAAFLGHCYPVWLGFKGGKGVATYLGTLLVLSPPLFVVAGVHWLIVAGLFRFSSLAALVAAFVAPVWGIFFAPDAIAVCAAMGALIWLRHAPNIRRLLTGEEPRIGEPPPPPP